MDRSNVDVSVRHINSIIGAGLVSVLSRDGQLRVLDEPSDPLDPAKAPSDEEPPQIVVTDYRTGLALLKMNRQCEDKSRQARVIMVTERGGSPHVRLAIEQGVAGYVLLDCDVSEIVTAVRKVASGNRYLCPAASQTVAESLVHTSLTQRELEVLVLVASGLANKLIARELSIALGTVKAHVKAALEKLGAKCRTEGVAKARKRGLLEVVDEVGELDRSASGRQA